MPRKTFITLFVITAIMRVLFIWRAPLWYDENFTLILARLPFWKMIQATAGDVHPPLWYIIEWLLFHAVPELPVWSIRLPALVFSMAAFAVFAKLTIVLQVPERIRIAALILMSLLPMQVWYAQEGRMYAMLEFLVLFALYMGLTRRWTAFTLATIALVYTQNYGLIYCAVIAAVLVILDWQDVTNVMNAGGLTLLAYIPWALVVYSQMADISGRYWIFDTSAGAVLNALYKQFWASSMIEAGIIGAYVVTFAALIIGLYSLMRERYSAWWAVLVIAFAPVGIAWLVSALWQPLLLFRPLIGISPFLYIIVCSPLELLDIRPSTLDKRLLYSACFILPVYMFGISGYYINIADMKGEAAESTLIDALDYVGDNWQTGDVIYYTDDGPMINLMPYTDKPQIKMPSCASPVLGSLSKSTRSAVGIVTADLADVPHTRAWVFAPRSPLHPACYEDQIAALAPIGDQLITVDDSEYITSGVWLVEK